MVASIPQCAAASVMSSRRSREGPQEKELGGPVGITSSVSRTDVTTVLAKAYPDRNPNARSGLGNRYSQYAPASFNGRLAYAHVGKSSEGYPGCRENLRAIRSTDSSSVTSTNASTSIQARSTDSGPTRNWSEPSTTKAKRTS